MGGLLADTILLAFAPISVFTLVKCGEKFSRLANKVSDKFILKDKMPDGVLETIFECL